VAKLWRTLLGRNRQEISRYGIDDYAADLSFLYNGAQYAIGGSSAAWAKSEDVETPFTGYIQSIYKSNGPIFAIILARLMLFTEARFCWFEINPDGEDGIPAGRQGLEALEAPWHNGGTGELLARAEQDVSLAGNFYVAREGSKLRRLRPDWLTIVLSAPPAEAVESDVVGYWYHPGRVYSVVDQPNPGDKFYPVDSGEVAHWSPIPDPDALYRGMSWLQPVVKEVLADKAATTHKGKFFDNGATLGQVIAAKENLTKKQFDVWKDTILAQHQGADRAYRPLFLASPVDVTVAGTNLQQLDLKTTQGAGETRLCAAGGVPPIIVGLSEGLASATYSNYSMARRKFGDHWARPQWRSIAQSLSTIVEAPQEDVRLGVNTAGIAFLREDQKDAAEIQQIKASTIRQYIDAGFEPDSCVAAVDADNRTLLKHSGLVSVQLLPPGTTADGEDDFDEDEDDTERARTGEELHRYWTAGAGLGRWVNSPTPFKTLLAFLMRHMPETKARKTAADWFREVKGFLPSGYPPGYKDKAEAEEPEVDPITLREQRERERRQQRKRRAKRSADPEVERANELKEYWLRGEGAARWTRWTQLYNHLRKHMADEFAKRTAAEWFHERYGFWPGHQRGDNPTGPG
jgi:hypothetical protein